MVSNSQCPHSAHVSFVSFPLLCCCFCFHRDTEMLQQQLLVLKSSDDIHPASVHTRLSLHSRGDWCQSPVVIGREVGCNLGCLTCFGNPTVVLFSNRSGKKVVFFFLVNSQQETKVKRKLKNCFLCCIKIGVLNLNTGC